MLRLPHIAKCLLLFLLLYRTPLAYAQQFDLITKKKQAWIRFTPVRDMVVIPLMINGSGPFNFVLDTGVGIMVITDPKLVDSIHIDQKRTIKLYGVGNLDDLEAYVTSPLNIVIGNSVKSEYVAAAILKDDHFGLSNYAGIKIHGLLGYEFFSQLAVKINFSDSTITVARPGRFKPFRKGAVIPLSIEDRKPYLNTNLALNNSNTTRNKLLVDLGAGHALLLENQRPRPNDDARYITANLGQGLTGPLNGRIGRIGEIEVGKYRFTSVITSFLDTVPRPAFTVARDGNLGIGILKKFLMVFDYANNKLYLKPNYKFKEPFEHDMSGLEYYAAGNELKNIIVSRVEPGSAGAEAGIKANDQITGINLRSIRQLTMTEIDDLFRSRDKRSLVVEIYRDGEYQTVILTLKRRV